MASRCDARLSTVVCPPPIHKPLLVRVNAMRICGLQGVSIIDFPGRIASVLFLGGCNFRCPFCHNPELVLHADRQADIGLADVLRSVSERKGLVDGVVVTGGEPLINGEALLGLLRSLRDLGLSLKLDTNGYETDMLRTALGAGVVDYVAMDVKTSLERYGAAAGRDVDTDRIREAIDVVRQSGVPHEFRTTCVPGLVEQQDVVSIASLLGRTEHYVLQQFRATESVLEPSFANVTPYRPETLQSFADAVKPLVHSVAVRGV